jgi:osmotically-inducible protein OsmY
VLRIVLLLALAIAGAQAQTKSQIKTKTPPPQGTIAPQDVQIEADIRGRLAKSLIGKDGITVRVQGGVAYWDGTTNVVQHKGAATRMAKSAGAKKVVNNIKVDDNASKKAAGNLEQGRRRAQIKRSEPR